MNPADTANSVSGILSVADDLNVAANSPRRIRSFVRRETRMTRAQHWALVESWERFGVEAGFGGPAPENWFGRCAPLVLEIGFGDGESLAAMAAANPETDYLGIEVHRPGVGHLLLRAEALGLTNLRIMCADAVEVLERQIPDDCLDRVQIFFPDPWPKTRHHKRRLIQPSFVTLLVHKLKSSGPLHIATDCEDYARSILNLLNATPGLLNQADGNGFAPRPAYRPATRFEQRGWRLGHQVRDILFARCERREQAIPDL
jgi:tRNA (guanine-N7-)-methyltransferase